MNRTLDAPMPIDLHALYPKLIHLMLDTVFVVDGDNQIVFVSDACEALLGYRADELVGTLITHYMHPEDLARHAIVSASGVTPVSEWRFNDGGRPLLLGVSRKSFIGKVLGSTDLADRAWPTVAITARARQLRSEGRDICSLSAGEPDFDTPAFIRQAARA